MANVFDTYVASPYVPAPFEQYAQAGQMQQKQYDTTQSQLQAQQDLLADMKVKPADVEYKNKLVQDIEAGAMEMLGRNKYYSPEMFQEVRSYVRKSARDPRFANLGAAYENYNKERAIEDKFRAEGKDYFYNHKKNFEATYDRDGNLMYNPSSEHLGIEERLDATKAAADLTGKLSPYVDKSKMVSGTMQIKRADGTTVEVPTLKQDVTSILSSKDPRVRKDVQDMTQNFLQSNAGRQWARLNATDQSGNVDQGKVLEFMLGTVAEKRSVDNQVTPLTGMASLIKGGGDTANITASSPFYSSAYNFKNLGQDPTIGNMVSQPGRNVEMTSFKELTKDERVGLYKKSKEEYNNYLNDYNKNVKNTLGMSGEGSINVGPPKNYNQWMEEDMGSVKGNPYGSLLQEQLKVKQKQLEDVAPVGTQFYSPEQSFAEFAKGRKDAITNSNALLLTTGETSMQPIGNFTGGSDIKNYEIEYAGHNAVIPSIHGGTQKAAIYRVFVPASVLNTMGLDEDVMAASKKDSQIKNIDGKNVPSFPVNIAVPMRQITSWQAAKEFDYKQYGPDKQIASDKDYIATNNINQNVDKFDEYGLIVQSDNKGNLFVIDPKNPNGRPYQVTEQEMQSEYTADAIINHINGR